MCYIIRLYKLEFNVIIWLWTSLFLLIFPSMELHIRGNPILAAGFLAILKYRNHGVPAKVAIIKNKVLVNDLFNFQAKRFPILRFGINPFTCLK
mgnify:CR=1 FL=1